jgi:hypothetical protein
MALPTSQQYFERFVEAARRHEAHIVMLDHGVYTVRLGQQGTRLAVLTGLHGNEPSGPLALLRWLEETPPGKLVREGQEYGRPAGQHAWLGCQRANLGGY